MNANFCKTFKFCVVIFLLTAGVTSAQSVDSSASWDNANSQQEVAPLYPSINKYRGKYAINERYLRTKEILNRLAGADSSAYLQYKKGRDSQHLGVGLIGAGGAFYVVGSVVTLINAFGDDDNGNGAFLLITGGGLMIAGIVTCITGADNKKKAIVRYNGIMKQKRNGIGFYIRPGLTGLSAGLRF